MRVAIFAHSFISDWNHGNAHFLRGVAGELLSRGIEVKLFEPLEAWSLENLIRFQGEEPVRLFHEFFPYLKISRYCLSDLDLERELEGVDLILVHEWNDYDLVAKIGDYRRRHSDVKILFHDTHHRSVTDPSSMNAYDLSNYDGVLAFGEVVRQIYLKHSWADRVYVWHEAADVRTFYPLHDSVLVGDLVWIGNWGDEERSAELREFLFEPVQELNIKCRVHGVRYPSEALVELEKSGIEYRGWIPNYKVPRIFSRFRLTVHIPRRPYVEKLTGVPTIRPFEALACGIPLICSPWEDSEGLFTPGEDFLMAANGQEMREHIRMLLGDHKVAESFARKGLATVHSRHTCAHRVDELLAICNELGVNADVNCFIINKTVKTADRRSVWG